MLSRLWRRNRERGDALIFALMALAVGTLLVAPLLFFVNTRQKQSLRYYDALRTQYASDAGAEYGLWKLTNDLAFCRTLALVNGAIPTVEVVCVDDGILSQASDDDWVIWAYENVDITKNNSVLRGDIYAGGDLTISGNNSVLSGNVYCSGTLTILGENTTFEGDIICSNVVDLGQHTVMPTPTPFPSVTPEPPVIRDIAEFNYPDCPATPVPTTVAGSACEAGMYYYHESNWEPGKHDDPQPGLHYGSGNIVIDDNNVDGSNMTMAAAGSITFYKNKNNFAGPYVENLVLFAAADTTDPPAILIDGNKFESSGGVIYAPNGLIELAGNNGLFSGASYVAEAVRITKNNAIIELPIEITGPEQPLGSCGLYDIRSTVGDTVTTVRIDKCGGEEGGLKILSWHVE